MTYDTTVTGTLVEQYVRLCRNPLPHRGDDVVAQEFEELCALPHVQAVAFFNPQTLMVGTDMISIKDPDSGLIHNVGEFLIYQYRQRNGKIYDTLFAFQNVQGTRGGYHHPHINVREVAGFGDLGQLCIQRGHFHIYQHLRSGEMHLSTKLLIDVLHTYNPGGPYHDLDNWPEREEAA